MRTAYACIAVVVLTTVRIAWGAGFDCAKASTAVEKNICADDELSDLDGRLGESYRRALETAPDRERLKAEHRAWLATERNRCADVACLKQAYERRLTVFVAASPPGLAADAPVVPHEAPLLDKAKGKLAVAAFDRLVRRFCDVTQRGGRTDADAEMRELARFGWTDACPPIESGVKVFSAGSFTAAGADEVLLDVYNGRSRAEGNESLAVMVHARDGYSLRRLTLKGEEFTATQRFVVPRATDILLMCRRGGAQGVYFGECGFFGKGSFYESLNPPPLATFQDPRPAPVDVPEQQAYASKNELSLRALMTCGPSWSVELGKIGMRADRLRVELVVTDSVRARSAGQDEGECDQETARKTRRFMIEYKFDGAVFRRVTPIPRALTEVLNRPEE